MSLLSFIHKKLKMDQIFESLTGYLEARIKLIRIEIKEEISESLARLIVFLLIGIFAIIAFVLISIGLSLWLGSLVESTFAGFFMLSLFYIFIVVGLVLLQKSDKLDNMSKILLNHIFTPKQKKENVKSN